MNKIKLSAILFSFTLLLSACGGGSGGSSTPPPPVNRAPTANAGADQIVPEFLPVDLSGSGTDSDGSVASYTWTQLSGATVSITNSDMQNATFEAPTTGTETSINLTFQLTVTDNDGAIDTDTVSITVETTNLPPETSAGSDQIVDEQSLVTLDGSASADSDGAIASYEWVQLSGTIVALDDPATISPSFEAPSLSSPEELIFRLTVTDDRGLSSFDEVTITVNSVVGLNESPLADAGSIQTVSSGQTVTLDSSLSTDSDGTVSDYAWVQSSGTPIVTLTDADTANPTFTAPDVTADTVLTFVVTVTDNEGATADDSTDITVTPMPTMVTISGKATYDNVPHTSTNALDYNNITQDPIRGAVVELLSGTTIVQSGLTDISGNYAFDVDPDSGTYFIRVKAHALLDDVVSWDAKVVDNTNGQALYALDSSNIVVATANITRNLNAASGWGGASYTQPRTAAPFHILDRVMDGHLKLQAVDPDVILTSVDINWSPNNSTTNGTGQTVAEYLTDLRNGDIGTSFYTGFPADFEEFSGPQFFILGAENSDTDEYDGHIIVHEWGHYFEDNLSRSDSIGGPHTSGDRLDMRVAFGEGFGNAWSGIITDDPVYRDSFGSLQSQGFSINVESNGVANAGWYNERSVQAILYDIYDSNNDGLDTLSLGLQPIYDILVGPQKTTEGFTSIYSFSEYFKIANPAAVSGLNSLLSDQSINGTDIWGLNETNDAGAIPSSNVLPVYTEISVGGGSKQVCSIDDFDSTGNTADSGNKLSNIRFVRFEIPTSGNYTFLISAGANQDPDMEIYLQGQSVAFAAPGGDGEPDTAATNIFNLSAGIYAAEAYEFDNTFRGDTTLSGDECFTVELQVAP